MARAEQITTRDKSSGRFHRRYLINGRYMVDERCNLDQAGGYEVMESKGQSPLAGIPLGTDLDLLCKWCFPLGERESDGG